MNEIPKFGSVDKVKASGAVSDAVSKTYMRKLIHEGKMPGFYSGNKFLINIPLFLEMLANSNSGDYVCEKKEMAEKPERNK